MTANFKRWAFVVSAAFNAATLGGLVYGAYFAHASASADLSLAPVWKQLNMNAVQRAAFQRSGGRARQEILNARDRMHQKWLEGIQLLAAPEVDWDAVRAKQAEISEANKNFNDLFFGIWVERARMLDRGQRAILFPAIEEQIKSGQFFNWHPPVRSQGGGK